MSGNIDPNEINQDTTTDMYVEMIANEDKLISEKRRWAHGDKMSNSDSDSDSSDDRQISDNTNNYKKLNTTKSSETSATRTSTQTPENKHGYLSSDKNSDTDDKPSYTGSHRDLTKEELRRRRLDMMRKFIDLRNAGVEISKNYNMNSDLSEMEDEYNLHVSIRSKSNAVRIMSHLLVGCVSGLEALNDNYNPFDMKTEGTLTTQINDEMEHYYDVLGEIYEKYNTPGKNVAPELRLLMMIGGTALKLQIPRFLNKMVRGQADRVNNNTKLIENLAKKASQDSNSHREKLNKVMAKDKMKKNMDDNIYLREKELEVAKIRSQDVSSIKNLDFSESMSKSSHLSEEKLLQAKNLAKKQKLQDLEMNMQRELNSQASPTVKKDAEREAKNLENLMNRIKDDDSSSESESSSNESTVSTLSQNPKGINKLIAKNQIKKGDISIGSSRGKTNKKSAINIMLSKKK